ncbi:unnamed protein product [Prorocentrum cordatum]|uniref:Rieske domain-containing protein n=1 Tax=Prorocentrum cordatum TaxID=2364126 RepID=A0ABN9RBW5_9DINO|nr:unnamed protein product [Polarella glacialis]
MRDACPHRFASLSRGRITASGLVQCAYHGWAFDGETGACLDVPQAPRPPGGSACSAAPAAGCGAQAVPAVEAAGLLWVLPGGSGALAAGAPAQPQLPPEMREGSGYRTAAKVVRDLPLDFAIVLENLVDYDHGPFAHQAAPFDCYSGSPQHPQRVRAFAPGPSAGSWCVSMETEPVAKMTGRVGTAALASMPDRDKAGRRLTATSTFTAPCGVTTCRRSEDGSAAFVVFFWAVPTGVGRSRFISGSLSGPASRAPAVPRLLAQTFVNRFLDQDTHLLATQQPYVLAAEFAAKAEGRPFRRAQFYRHRSPGEAMLVALERFLDAAAPAVPGRYALLPPGASGESAAEAARRAFGCPPRRVTLDRFSQKHRPGAGVAAGLPPPGRRFARAGPPQRAAGAAGRAAGGDGGRRRARGGGRGGRGGRLGLRRGAAGAQLREGRGAARRRPGQGAQGVPRRAGLSGGGRPFYRGRAPWGRVGSGDAVEQLVRDACELPERAGDGAERAAPAEDALSRVRPCFPCWHFVAVQFSLLRRAQASADIGVRDRARARSDFQGFGTLQGVLFRATPSSRKCYPDEA